MLSLAADLSLFEKARILARAFSSFDTQALGEGVADELAREDLQIQREDIRDKWICAWSSLAPSGRWYSKVTANGKGESRAKLPADAFVAYEIDVRGHDPVTPVFVDLLDRIKAGEKSTYAENGLPADATLSSGDAAVERLDRWRATLDPAFNENKIAEFRRWVRDVAEVDETFGFVAVLPDHLVAFSRHIAELRAEYAADSLLTAGVSAACDVCLQLGKAAGIEEFGRLAYYLTSGTEHHPVRILNGIVTKAARDGFGEHVADVARAFMEKVNRHIEQGLDSEALDAHFDELYRAIPYAAAAMWICAWLRTEDGMPESTRKRAKGAYRIAEETLVRLIAPFKYQVVDLIANSQNSKLRCAWLAQVRESRGEDALQAEVRAEIERHLVFPRAFLPILLECANTPVDALGGSPLSQSLPAASIALRGFD